MRKFEVLFYDITTGREDIMFVKASSADDAIDTVERMGEYEVIEVIPFGQEL